MGRAQAFPKSVTLADLVTTLDIELTAEGDGYGRNSTSVTQPAQAARRMTRAEIAFGPGRFQAALIAASALMVR